MIWIIERRLDGLNADAVAEAAHRLGVPTRLVIPDYDAALPNDLVGGEDLATDANAIFNGSLKLFAHLMLTRSWKPLGWCDIETLSCSQFAQHFHKYMFNQDARILSVSEVAKHEQELYRQFSVNHKFFVRPDSVQKLFAGQVVDISDLIDFLSSQTDDHSTKVLIGRPQTLQKEWRIFVADNKIVDGCKYKADGEISISPGIPHQVSNFVQETLSEIKWRPHPLFVMDICESNDCLRIMEFNSYNCSGLYACSPAKLIDAAINFVSSQSPSIR